MESHTESRLARFPASPGPTHWARAELSPAAPKCWWSVRLEPGPDVQVGAPALLWVDPARDVEPEQAVEHRQADAGTRKRRGDDVSLQWQAIRRDCRERRRVLGRIAGLQAAGVTGGRLLHIQQPPDDFPELSEAVPGITLKTA